jgi:hypothetical protein
MTTQLSWVRLTYSGFHIVESTPQILPRPMKDFIPLLFLFLVWGYVVAPGAVLWAIAVYGALCKVLWRAPYILCCGAARLWERMCVSNGIKTCSPDDTKN